MLLYALIDRCDSRGSRRPDAGLARSTARDTILFRSQWNRRSCVYARQYLDRVGRSARRHQGGHEGIWIVSFMQYDLGYIDLEEKTLQPLPTRSPELVTS